MLNFLLWLSNFKTKTSFGFLVKKSAVVYFFIFFQKSKNKARTAKNEIVDSFSKTLMVL